MRTRTSWILVVCCLAGLPCWAQDAYPAGNYPTTDFPSLAAGDALQDSDLPPGPQLPGVALPPGTELPPGVEYPADMQGQVFETVPVQSVPQANWRFRVDALFLDRTEGADYHIFDDGTPFLFNPQLGPRLGAVRRLPEGKELGAWFFSIDDWAAFATSAIEIFDDPSAYGLYRSKLRFGNIEMRVPFRNRMMLTYGFGMAELDERLQVASNDTVDFRTWNHLYGAVGGLDMNVWDRGGALQIMTYFRAGGYWNHASGRFTGSEALLVDNEDLMTFIGEAGLTARLRVVGDIYMRMGYQVMWFGHVALAPDQMGTAEIYGSTYNLHTNGDVFYHGGFVGIEVQK